MTQWDNMYAAPHIFYIINNRRDREDRGDI